MRNAKITSLRNECKNRRLACVRKDKAIDALFVENSRLKRELAVANTYKEDYNTLVAEIKAMASK